VPPAPDKRRHHYVPVTYLNGFADAAGKVAAYPKDEPVRVFKSKPDRIAFENYYYSQVTPEGLADNNTLEDLFSGVETAWPALVDDLAAGRRLGARAGDLLEFITLLRVRVPAARDAVERFEAEAVRMTLRHLDARGDLPAWPAGLDAEKVVISIDPNRSLQAMPHLLKGLANLIERLGFEVVHNATPTDFITSDNPVIHYDPEQPSDRLRPYENPPGRPAVFLVPLTRRLLLRGCTGLPILKTGDEIGRVEIHDEGEIERLNGLIARFGYRFVFAADAGLGPKLAAFADHSPIAHFQHLPVAKGSMLATRFIFGTRPDKPRWTPADAT
jgi:hypothetical protein